MDTEQELADRLVALDAMPYGPARSAATESVLARAEAAGYARLTVEARLELIEAYVHGGETARQFPLFAASLAAYRAAPETFDPRQEYSLLWSFKYAVGGMRKFPSISLAQTERVLDEMETEYRRYGSTLYAVHSCRHKLAAHVGDTGRAEDEFDRWRSTPRDNLADCIGCDPEDQVRWLTTTGRDAEAVDVADAVLSGRFTCIEQPQGILTALLLPYTRLGRVDDAADAQARAYRVLRHQQRTHLLTLGDHVEFLALTGNEARGLETLERHLGGLDAPEDPQTEMWFTAHAALLMRRLRELGRGDLPVTGGSVRGVPAAELERRWSGRALEIAAQFDVRNGTTAQSDRVRATLAAEPLTDRLPLHGVAGRDERRVRPPVATATPPPAPDLSVADLLARWHDAWQLDLPASSALAELVVARAAEVDAARPGASDEARAYLASRDDRRSDAAAAFDRAGAAYRAAGDDVSSALMAVRAGVVRAAEPTSSDAVSAEVDDAADLAHREGDGHERAVARIEQARAHAAAGDLARAVGIVEAITPPGHPADAARLARLRASIAAADRRWPDALRDAELSRRLLAEAGQPVQAAVTAQVLVDGLVMTDRVDEALELVDATLPLLERPDERAERYEQRARICMYVDDHAAAARALTEAVALWTACGRRAEAASSSARLGWCQQALGRPVAAAESIEAAMPALDESDADEAFHARLTLLDALDRLGDVDDAVRLADAYAEMVGFDGPPTFRARVDARTADLLGDRNDPRAAQLRQRALRLHEQAGDGIAVARETASLGVDLLTHDPVAADAAFDRARTLAAALPAGEDFDPRLEVADVDRTHAWALWRVDRNEEAEPFAAAAEAACVEAGRVEFAGRIATLRARLVAERGDVGATREHAARARAHAERIDDPDLAAALRRELDEIEASLPGGGG